jgi:hypothetical protein
MQFDCLPSAERKRGTAQVRVSGLRLGSAAGHAWFRRHKYCSTPRAFQAIATNTLLLFGLNHGRALWTHNTLGGKNLPVEVASPRHLCNTVCAKLHLMCIEILLQNFRYRDKKEYHAGGQKLLISRSMSHRRGNPNWGRPAPPAPAIATEFEIIVRQLRLIPEIYASSPELKRWCERNRNRCYVPEWLLKKWQMTVELSYGHDAA